MEEQPYNIYIPVNLQTPLYTSVKTGPWYVIIATDIDKQKQDADEKEFVEIVEKFNIKVTEQINSQINLSVQTVENDTW